MAATVVSVVPAPAAAAGGTGWTPAEQINEVKTTVQNDLTSPSIAVAPSGKMLAAWEDSFDYAGSTIAAVFYKMYDPASGWGAQSVIFDDWGGSVTLPQVAASANGDFVLVFVFDGGLSGAILGVRQYDATADSMINLGSPVTSAPISVDAPTVAVDQDGNALVAWLESSATEINVTAAFHYKGGAWSNATVLDTRTDYVIRPRAVIDPAGAYAVVCWEQSGVTHRSVWASSFETGTWSSPAQVDTIDAEANNNEMALEPGRGTVQVVWLQDNGTAGNIFSRQWIPGDGWQPQRQVSQAPNSGAGLVSIAGGPSGFFVAAWNQFNGIEYQMMASIFDSVAWATPTNLSAPWDAGGGSNPFVAMDAFGGATVVWNQYGGGHPLQVYSAWGHWGNTFTTPVRADASGGQDATLRGLAMNAAGSGVALWSRYDGYNNNLFASAYAMPDTTPPAVFAYVVGGDVTHNSSVVVEGGGSMEAGATVNGVPGYYVDFGIWHAVVPVHPGNNTLFVSVHDAAGNYASQYLYVTFDDPVPGLEQDLAAAQAAAAAAQASANAAQAQAATAQAALQATQNRLTDSENNVTALRNSTANAAAAQAEATQSAANAAASASMMGLLGIVVGIAGAGIAIMAMRKPKAPAVDSPSPPKATESAPKADEPPKQP